MQASCILDGDRFMKFGKLELFFTLLLAAVVLLGAYGEQELNDLSSQVIRLHVVANSDSAEDQALKLQVRDAVLSRAAELTAGATTRQDAGAALQAGRAELEAAALDVVREAGYPYSVTAQLGCERFDTRDYGEFALPAGTYTSLRVTIGAGAGRNWWCVGFPPLCTAAGERDVSAFSLTEESEAVITRQDSGYVLKFRLLELIGEVKNLFGW